tara:strand:- start:963 stop:1151 length:189 start_codon:yes stop_codon:yes gene_type:complete
VFVRDDLFDVVGEIQLMMLIDKLLFFGEPPAFKFFVFVFVLSLFSTKKNEKRRRRRSLVLHA